MRSFFCSPRDEYLARAGGILQRSQDCEEVEQMRIIYLSNLGYLRRLQVGMNPYVGRILLCLRCPISVLCGGKSVPVG